MSEIIKIRKTKTHIILEEYLGDNLISISSYKGADKDGEWIKFYRINGKIKHTGFYKNNLKEGWWFYYPEDYYSGNLSFFFKKGKIVIEKFEVNGKLQYNKYFI